MPNYRNKNKNRRNKTRNKNRNQNTNHNENQSQSQNIEQNKNRKYVNENKTEDVEQCEQHQAADAISSSSCTQYCKDSLLTSRGDDVASVERNTCKHNISGDGSSNGTQAEEAVPNVAGAKEVKPETITAMGTQSSKTNPNHEGALVMAHGDENPSLKTSHGKIIVQRISQNESPEEVTADRQHTAQAHTQPYPDICEDNVKVIIHPVSVEEPNYSHYYHVEHPETEDSISTQTAKNKMKPIQIQEMSDEGSNADSTDNPPLVSEAESEPEPDTAAGAGIYERTTKMVEHSDIVDLQTMAVDEATGVNEALCTTSPTHENELKQRRAQKRAALETHFLPQLLSPRYLDSIIEENSDMSDAKSDCSDNPTICSPTGKEGCDNTNYNSDPKSKRANAVFPKSNLDFSKKHKHGPVPKKSPILPVAIREEPVAMVVATKLVESNAAEESCSRLSSIHTLESEAAEVVYIDSASSSLSDLLELDSEETDEDTYHSAIDLDTDVYEIIAKPVKTEYITNDSRESTPVNQVSPPTAVESSAKSISNNAATKIGDDDNKQHRSQSQNENDIDIDDDDNDNKNEKSKNVQLIEKATEHTTPLSNILSSGSTSSTITKLNTTTTTANSKQGKAWQNFDTDNSSEAKNSTANASNSLCAEHIVEPAAVLKNIEMNSVREIIKPKTDGTSATNLADIAFNVTSGNASDPIILPFTPHEKNTSDIPPPVPPPPFYTNFETAEQRIFFSDVNPALIPKEENNYHLHQEQRELVQRQTQSSPSTNSTLLRQESADSHCSDSTNYSQCTAINVGSGSFAPNDFDHTSSISDDNSYRLRQQPSTSKEQADAPDSAVDSGSSSGENSDAAIKKLRLLCTETLASMPYGQEVLEELATVAQGIHAQSKTNMPYPLPHLPYISDLQMSVATNNDKSPQTIPRTIAIQQISTNNAKFSTSRPLEQPPPPVPAPPTNYDTWLGLPTTVNPKLLVCLSPAQRSCIDEQTVTTNDQPDQLLDAHQKFLERRGYHEYSDEQVKAMNVEKMEEQQILKTAAIMKKLRKSLTPPPPIPPPPVPHKSAETAAKAQSQAAKTVSDNDVNNRNANEQQIALLKDGENSKHKLLTIIHNTDVQVLTQKQPQPQKHSEAQSQQNQMLKTSSFENNSRQSAGEQGETLENKLFEATATALPYATGRTNPQLTRSSAKTQKFVEGSFPVSSSNKMQSVESELAKLFPSMGHTNIFETAQKRFSNIESSSINPYCSQLLNSQPKRYSNIETRSYEAEKRTENGEVVYDSSNCKHEAQSDGDKSIISSLQFPIKKMQNTFDESEIMQTAKQGGNEKIMSAAKLNANSSQPTTTANMTNLILNKENAKASLGEDIHKEKFTLKAKEVNDNIKNRIESEEAAVEKNISATYEEFRQRAKEAAEAATATISTPQTAPPVLSMDQRDQSAFHFDHENLFKDFDELSNQLHMELESSKAQKEQREKSASLYDLSRMQWHFKDHFNDLKKQRHEHMKELEREIERSMHSRRLRNFDNHSKLYNEQQVGNTPHTIQIPIKIEKDNSSIGSVYTSQEQRTPNSYEIPIQVETNNKIPTLEPSSGTISWDFDVNNAARFQRAESMFNLSEHVPRPHSQQAHNRKHNPDNSSRFGSDLNISENIARPFTYEVETCYHRQKPRTIRAPRLSVSTNDLSSNLQCFDSCNAYSTRRTHAPMLNQTPKKMQPQYSSCYSVLERDPNPTYISTTSRRGVSPVPPVPPSPQQTHYDPRNQQRYQRRASLPKEVHEQQLKYILSKEEELKMEFERLQNERRRLFDEMHSAPTLNMSQHPLRDMYRPVTKLPTVSEEEVFRQQMAEEWLNKVAEREERRLQKIIKISKVNESRAETSKPAPSESAKTDISEEFLNRVKERRTKLAIPADSDWESGAESQPVAPGHASESDEVPHIKVIEGKKETDLRRLPPHLREFAKFSNHQQERIDNEQRDVHHEEERRQEANNNSVSSAIKKSSVVKTVKIFTHPANKAPEHTTPGSVALPRSSATTDEQVLADTDYLSTTAPKPFSAIPNSPFFTKLPATFGEMFATSPFKSRIYEEFEHFWRSFDKTS